MKRPEDRLVCPKCGEAVDPEDLTCPSCEAPLQTVLVKRATRGRRYVYGKRKAGLSPEVIWLLVVILIGLLIIVGTQLFAFMRSRKLVEQPTPPARIARALALVGAASSRDRSLPLPAVGAASSRDLATANLGRRDAGTVHLKGTSHETCLRHLCHAHRSAGGGNPGFGGHRV